MIRKLLQVDADSADRAGCRSPSWKVLGHSANHWKKVSLQDAQAGGCIKCALRLLLNNGYIYTQLCSYLH